MNVVPVPGKNAIKNCYKLLADGACAVMQEFGEVPPEIFVISVEEDADEHAACLRMGSDIVMAMYGSRASLAVFPTFIARCLDASDDMHKAIAKEMDGLAPNMVVAVSEAWTSESVGGSLDEAKKKMPAASEDPNRKESILVVVYTTAGTHVGMCPVDRDQAGKPTARFLDIDLSSEVAGRMVPGSEEHREEIESIADDLSEVMSERVGLDKEEVKDVIRTALDPSGQAHQGCEKTTRH